MCYCQPPHGQISGSVPGIGDQGPLETPASAPLGIAVALAPGCRYCQNHRPPPLPKCMQLLNTSNTWVEPEFTGRGLGCTSLQLTQLSTECSQAIQRVSASALRAGSNFSMKSGQKNGISTPCPCIWKFEKVCGRTATPQQPHASPHHDGDRNGIRDAQKECMQHSPMGHIAWHP